MKYTVLTFLLSLSIDSVIADSESFTLKLSASGTDVSGYNIYIGSDEKIYVADTTQTCSGVVTDSSTLVINGYTMGIGKNFLSLTSDSSSFETAEPFTIVDGVLKLYGSNFHVIPSGEDGIYVLGSINAMGSSTRVEVEIIAEGSDGSSVPDFDASSATSTSSSAQEASTTSSTQEATTSSSTEEAKSSTSESSSITTSTPESSTISSSTSEPSVVTTSTSETANPSSAKVTTTSSLSKNLPASSSAKENTVFSSSKSASTSSSSTSLSAFENMAVRNGVSVGGLLLGAFALL